MGEGGLITLWQGEIRLAEDRGLCAAGEVLPQDEATAAVMIAAILARNFASDCWPGWYRAQLDGPGDAVTVEEGDTRVRLARVLLERRQVADFTAPALAVVRARVLASTLGGSGLPVGCAGGPGVVAMGEEGCGG